MAKSKKSKRSGSASDNFLFQHGEKFLFALIFIIAVWLISKGSGLEKFTLTPEEIKESAAKADDRIKNNNVSLADVDETLVVYNYSEYSRRVRDSLKAGPYQTAIRWDQSLFPDKIKRPNIIPLSVENLRATACVGAIRYRNEGVFRSSASGAGGVNAGNAQTGAGGPTIDEGRHWITVTGLVPVGKEFKIYGEKFSNAQYNDTSRDVPIYVFYEIERGVKGENGEIDWTPINLEQVYEKEVDRWAGLGIDPVDPSHAVPVYLANSARLTMPCPPMVNKPFGMEVTNPPKIPLLSEEQMESRAEQLKERDYMEEELKKLNKRDFSAARSQSVFDAETSGVRTPGAEMQAGNVGFAPGMQGNLSSLIRGKSGANENLKSMEDDYYYLFRHFDFDVEEGKTYYYRVKLFLANPNYRISDINLVEDPNTVGQPEIESEYSAPSNPVSRGNESRVLVESIEPPSRPWQDPKITLASIFFNTEDAQESIISDKKVVRGQVANFLKEPYKPINLTGVGVTQGLPQQQMKGGRRNAKVESVNYISDICVLDTVGGEKITGSDLRSPSTLFVLDPNGLIETHKLDEDTRELTRYSGVGQGQGQLQPQAQGRQ